MQYMWISSQLTQQDVSTTSGFIDGEKYQYTEV